MLNTIRSILAITLIACLSMHPAKTQILPNTKIVFINDTSANFNSLTSRFRGKIIYVDIWAMWCEPCRKELQQEKDVKAFKDFALKNNIVILYICCDKQGSTWKTFVTANHLNGYHIAVNKCLNRELHTTFSTVQKRRGVLKRSFYIPRHMIIDQYGAVADSTAGQQGSPSVYLKINKLMNKKA